MRETPRMKPRILMYISIAILTRFGLARFAG